MASHPGAKSPTKPSQTDRLLAILRKTDHDVFHDAGGEVLKALLRIGWTEKRRSGGSDIVLQREGWQDSVWAFRPAEEIGPRMLARISKKTGLTPEDL